MFAPTLRSFARGTGGRATPQRRPLANAPPFTFSVLHSVAPLTARCHRRGVRLAVYLFARDVQPLPPRIRVPAHGRPAPRHRRARAGPQPRRPVPDAARRDGHGQDVHHAPTSSQQIEPADAGDEPQQDAGRAALRRVQGASSPTTPSSTSSSYYDYYQPEAYIPRTDTYIEKDIGHQRARSTGCGCAATRARCRAAATCSSSRRCRASTASARPRSTRRSIVQRRRRATRSKRNEILHKLVAICSTAATTSTSCRGTFRVRGDVVEIFPAYSKTSAYRIEFLGDEIESGRRDRPAPRQGAARASRDLTIYPAKHYVTPEGPDAPRHRGRSRRSCVSGSACSRDKGKMLEAQRLEQRTLYDLEMMEEVGYCPGIENYSRHLDRPPAGRTARTACSTTSPRTSC